MSCASVLIVEDDADINQIVATRLARAGMSCTQAFSGSEAKLLLATAADGARAGGAPFDVVISDLMLPGMTGEELIGLIRAQDPATPIIVISARATAADRIDILKLGADDYLTKPFDLDELVARIEVQLRHRRSSENAGTCRDASEAVGAANSDVLSFQRWTLDRTARTLNVDDAPIELTRIEFNILDVLMAQPKRVFTKQELFEQAWGEPYGVDDNTLNVHVSNIRSKLRPSGTDGYIKTVWGMGFRLVDA